MKQFQLQEGSNLYILPMSKFKTTHIGILLHTKLDRKTVTRNALLPQVLKRGSKTFKTYQDISKYMEELYGAIFDASVLKKGERHIIQCYLEIMNDHIGKEEDSLLEKGFHFLYEILYNPLIEAEGFRKEYVELEKQNLRQQIEGRVNDKKTYATERCLEEMCKEEPFGIYGDGYIEDLEEIEEKKLYGYYQEVITSAPMDIFVAGDVDAEEIYHLLNRIWTAKKANLYQIPEAEVIGQVKEIKKVEERMEIAQGKLCIGYRTGVEPKGKRFYQMMVLNGVLGGGPHSKLFQNVREKESLCYYVFSFIYRFKGILSIQAGIEFKNYEKTVSIIEDQIRDLQQGNIIEEELENAKQTLIHQFKGLQDHPASLMDYYLSQVMVSDVSSLEEVLQEIQKVRKADVIEVSKDIQLDTIYFLKGEESHAEK